jgi:hypothetical protein
LQAGLGPSVQNTDRTLGHLEETLSRETRSLQRHVLEEAAQKKADSAERHCPHCGSRLTRCSKYQVRTFESRFGPITVRRLRGWCRRCDKWRYPADGLLGLEETQALREKGEEPIRWHWAYGGTCFQLSQRGETAGGRPVILSRGYVTTRGGVDALREQLWAEAMRHGLGRARDVLIVADGAVWIWNLANDRFAGARQRLDLAHASQPLWAAARTLHPEDEAAARRWVEPVLTKLRSEDGVEVIDDLTALVKRLRGAKRGAVKAERDYLATHRERLDDADGAKRGEPLGSGAIESTGRQYQCRFKRPGQFWSTTGDEALICLETFWRNDRWLLLFPHAAPADPSRN